MNIIFFGNTKYSLIGAAYLHQHLTLSLIVTIPDRPDKRGNIVENPLKSYSKQHKIEIIQTEKLTDDIMQQIAKFNPDFFVVEDYGLLLPQKLLDIPKIASLNIHHSLLPKYRGSSPAPTAILNGDKITGVSVIKMTQALDAGDILGQEEYAIKPTDTTDSLLTVLNEKGAELMVKILRDYENYPGKSQKEKDVVFTKMMKKEDGFIDLTNPPASDKIDRMIRAYYPWPAVWTRMTINGKEKIVKFLPGEKLQVEGKNPMSVKDFLNGYPELKKTVSLLFLKPT